MRRNSGLRPLSRTLPIVAAALLGLVVPSTLATAAAAHEAAPRSWNVKVGSETPNQAIQGMAFLPADIYVDAGDTVNWVANGAEIHTVTFLASGQALTPFNPFDPTELTRQGSGTYDGVSYYNSGILSNVSDSGFPSAMDYSLVFPHTGDFTYFCLVHGEMMKGSVHVRDAGTSYPYTQRQYDRQSAATERAIVLDGLKLKREITRQADRHTVFAGADDGIAMYMRFVRPTVVVHVGEKVTFTNGGMAAPHTVTFGTEPPNPFAPSGDPATFAGGNLSSGIIPPGGSYTVTFTTAGSFDYICALHDYMGMTGKVIVEG
jgi:plastocyanin